MRVFGQPVEPNDLKDCMEPMPDGPASPDAVGRKRQRYRVLQNGTGVHIGTYIGLNDGNLDGAFWIRVITAEYKA
jgi:hypothetical protein